MEFKELFDLILPEIKQKMETNEGLFIFAKERTRFEDWLRVELCNILLKSFNNVVPKRKWIDITFEDWAIKVKTINTSYRYENVKITTYPVTQNMRGIINDIKRLQSSEYRNKAILFIVFPLHSDNKNWEVHLKRISELLREIESQEFKFRDKIPGVLYFGLI